MYVIYFLQALEVGAPGELGLRVLRFAAEVKSIVHEFVIAQYLQALN